MKIRAWLVLELVWMGFAAAVGPVGSADEIGKRDGAGSGYGSDVSGYAPKHASRLVCRKLEFEGEVKAGDEWRHAIGEGWIFRVMPIGMGSGAGQRYSGWDLVMDREDDGRAAAANGAAAGYPDGLLLATPPYGSLTEREIGTTFGLRAQDALGWNPRHFRFLTEVDELARARRLFQTVTGSAGAKSEAQGELLTMADQASRGEFEITDAKLTLGDGDPEGFARQWAGGFRNMPHTVEQAAGVGAGAGLTPGRGEIRWMRFRVTFWLPERFALSRGVNFGTGKCAE